jgi:hypothetical protein
MTIFQCPKDGCDYEGDSLPALRSHANAMTDHDWSELKDDVGEEPDSDGSDEPASDSGPEPAGEQTEASQTDEYAEQWGEGEEPDDQEETDDVDEPEDDADDDDQDDTGESGSIGAGAALAAGSLVVGLLVVLARDNDEEPEEVPSTSSDVPERSAGPPAQWGGTGE